MVRHGCFCDRMLLEHELCYDFWAWMLLVAPCLAAILQDKLWIPEQLEIEATRELHDAKHVAAEVFTSKKSCILHLASHSCPLPRSRLLGEGAKVGCAIPLTVVSRSLQTHRCFFLACFSMVLARARPT